MKHSNWRYPLSNISSVRIVFEANMIDSEVSPTLVADSATVSTVIFYMYNQPVTGENLAYSLVVLLVTVLLIVTSLLTILVIITTHMRKEIVGNYLISLAVTDLLCGTLVTPVSIYAALDEHWKFGNVSALCKIEAYLEVALWASTVYTFIWTGVDRYAALTKPARYEVEQTLTRCKCWIIFTWIAAVLLCCPTLFYDERKHAKYDEDTFMCQLNWNAMAPYSLTLGILVVVPSFISVFHSYSYIFRQVRNPRNLEEHQKLLLENDTSYVITFFVIITFIVSWAPYFLLRIYETMFGHYLKSRCLQFTFLWLAIAGGNWKFIIYCLMNHEFRRGLRNVYKVLCGLQRQMHSDSAQYIRLNERKRSFF